MSRIVFDAKSIQGVCPARDCVVVEADMTESQMFEAVQGFLQHITDATWADWQRRLDTDAPSAHEAFSSDGSAFA